jgi:hypothetical protein
LIPTKLPHYLLPAYPALALLAAAALVEGVKRPLWLDALSGLLWTLATLAISTVLIAAPVSLGHGLSPAGLTAAAIALLMGWSLLYRFWNVSRPAPGIGARAAILALLVLAPTLAFVAPRLDFLWLSRSAAGLVHENADPGASISVAGYAEPSLIFLLGTNTRIGSGAEAAQALVGYPSSLALVEGSEESAFRQALAKLGKKPHAIGNVAGLDYSNGKPMTLTLYSAP